MKWSGLCESQGFIAGHGPGTTILADGFRDWSGSYGLRDVEGTPLILTGVFISDRPLSANDGDTHGPRAQNFFARRVSLLHDWPSRMGSNQLLVFV
jgi:hypothetical protein